MPGSPRLRYFLRRILGESQCIEDVLQDVWLQVFRGLPTLADAGAFRTWLYRIARDRAYREFRKRPLPFNFKKIRPSPSSRTATTAFLRRLSSKFTLHWSNWSGSTEKC
jgi:DNA-directed RNA polymerase specialized sigma24 family protein